MSYIAHLDLAVNHSLRGERWRALANEIGVPFREYIGPSNIDTVADFIRGATGLVLPDDSFLHEPKLIESIKEHVAAGHPLLARVGPNSLARLNLFLSHYGLEGTRLAIHDIADKSGGGHSRLIELKRSESPRAFHPHPLLDGVNNLVIQQPNAIRYSSNATPMLVLPRERKLFTVDLTTDFPADWTSPELTCLALSPLGGKGGVLGLSCGFTHDAYGGPTGVAFPGITAGDNEALATNILKWLAGQLEEPRDVAIMAFDNLDRIERSLVEFIHKRLQDTLGEDWWTKGIPLPIRKKCADRCEEEGNLLPKASYLDLLDVQTILRKNWRLFERDWAAAGWSGGKESALSWFSELNDIRKSVMHPVRRHFVPNLVDHTTVSKLSDWLNRIQRLGVKSEMVH